MLTFIFSKRDAKIDDWKALCPKETKEGRNNEGKSLGFFWNQKRNA